MRILLTNDDGVVGWSECVAGEQPNYSAETIDTAWLAIRDWLAPRLLGSSVESAAAVFAQVNDLRRWEDWSPWAKLDPNAKVTFSGPQSGQGSTFKWDGNDKIGAGTMTITESKPNERVATRTDFVKPFEGTSYSDFIFWQTGDRTNVTWTMSGHQNFIGKAFCLFMPMEQMLGPEFEKGLAQLRQVVEKK